MTDHRPRPIALVCAMPMELHAAHQAARAAQGDRRRRARPRVGDARRPPGRRHRHRHGHRAGHAGTERLLDAVHPRPGRRRRHHGRRRRRHADRHDGPAPSWSSTSETGSRAPPAPLGGGTTQRHHVDDQRHHAAPPSCRRCGPRAWCRSTWRPPPSPRAASARGIPWSVFRAISDRATDGSIDDEVFHLSNQDGTPEPEGGGPLPTRHPVRIPRLVRMGMGARKATIAAAEAAIAGARSLP